MLQTTEATTLYKWTSPDGQYRNLIDCVIGSRRWRRRTISAKTRPATDWGTDHVLFISNIRINPKNTEKIIVPKYNENSIPDEFKVHIQNRFAQLNIIDQEPG